MKKLIRITLLCMLFVAVSCQNSGNNSTETFTIESTITPANAGSVSPSAGSYESGDQIQITATANSNFVFREWNGDLTGSTNPASITITKNMSINALFEELTYPLTVEVEGQGEVSEQIVNAKTDYTEGTTVQLTAEPAEGWEFAGWSGDLDGSENPATITMDEAKNITTSFEAMSNTYPLTVNIDGDGEVSEEIVSGKTTDYNEGTIVELTAEPADEWQFVEWSGDLESSENPATITMDGPKTIDAVFGWKFGFYEDFEDGEAQNWIFSDDRFSIEDGVLQFSTESNTEWGAGIYDQDFSNFKIETKVALMEGDNSLVEILSIFIRANGDGGGFLKKGYMLGFTPNREHAVFYRLANGEFTKLDPEVEIPEINSELGEYNVITMNVVDSVFELFINGEFITSFSDDAYSKGPVGIGTAGEEKGRLKVSWDHIKVTAADPLSGNK